MLKVNNLSKMYSNGLYGLKNVSFELKEGEIVGLIGKNGAGKTTLIKLISKALHPSEGEVYFDGIDIHAKPNSLKEASFLLEPVFYSHLSAYDNIKFYLEVNDLEEYIPNIDQILKVLDLYDRQKDNPKSFSFGMKQRLGVAMSLVAEPKLVVLDEPFVGLDPIGVDILNAVLKEWATERKMTVLISSHQLTELQQICSRFLYIEGGRLKETIENVDEAVTIIELKEPVQAGLVETVASDAVIKGNKVYLNESSEDLAELIKFLVLDNEIVNIQSQKDESLRGIFEED